MKKLIKLLNKYRNKELGYNVPEWEEYEIGVSEDKLISKRFGFIRWLVDNDKIDFESENYPLKKYYPYFNDDVLAIVSQDCNTYEDHCRVWYDKYESLLMLLAIQDEPIEFLISILK